MVPLRKKVLKYGTPKPSIVRADQGQELRVTLQLMTFASTASQAQINGLGFRGLGFRV